MRRYRFSVAVDQIQGPQLLHVCFPLALAASALFPGSRGQYRPFVKGCKVSAPRSVQSITGDGTDIPNRGDKMHEIPQFRAPERIGRVVATTTSMGLAALRSGLGRWAVSRSAPVAQPLR